MEIKTKILLEDEILLGEEVTGEQLCNALNKDGANTNGIDMTAGAYEYEQEQNDEED